MARSLKIRRSATTPANNKHLRGFRLRIEIVEAIDITSFLFVHRRHPKDPYDGSVFDEFCTVTTIMQLSEVPEARPDPEVAFPFFRQKFMEVDVRSQQTAEECWDTINTLLCSLVKALNNIEDLVVEETLLCGEEDEVSESVSEAPSESPSEGVSESVLA